MFSRRGYNIESLTVGVTADPRYSRMTVVSLGDQNVLEQIKNQLNKLEDVRDIKELHPDRSVYRELMMIKVRAGSNDRQAVSAISSIFRATIVDDEIRRACQIGIRKVNISSDFKYAFFKKVDEVIQETGGFVPAKVLTPGINDAKQVIREKMELFGSLGKAELYR